jgi:hypothetical protein
MEVRTGNKRHHVSHGESAPGRWTAEYRAYANMLTRCYNKQSTRYEDWGGRGVSVCDEWRSNYLSFLRDVGRRPSSSHSLDRWPNQNGNYEPGNVRWATVDQQCRNKRSNIIISAFSKTMTLIEWAEHLGLPYKTLHSRVNAGWPPEVALSKPIRQSTRWHKERK